MGGPWVHFLELWEEILLGIFQTVGGDSELRGSDVADLG